MIPVCSPEIFYHPGNELGECPRWHPFENRLYWTDIETSRVFRQAPGDLAPEILSFEYKIGSFGFRKGGGLVLATSSGLKLSTPENGEMENLADPEAGKKEARFNDGRVDSCGRFWAGTMTETDASSSLYRLDADHSLHCMISGITISNGIGWNPDNDLMYYTDTLEKTIWVLPYYRTTGSLGPKKVFIRTKGEGLPDGLSVDVDGNLWSVQCGAGRINIYDPKASLVEQIELPTRCITACTFGGKQLMELYVTSSKSLLTPEERSRDKFAGAVFRIQTGTRGLPDVLYAG